MPDPAHSARRTARCKPLSRAAQLTRRPTHKLVRSRFARHSFTHAAGCRVARQHLCFDGQAVNGHVLAARAQEPSVGIADRWLATWRVQFQAVRAVVARSVSRRCATVPTDASMSARSARKATAEVGIGGSANRVIEADVPPTSPGHGDACGGGYRLTRLYKVNNPVCVSPRGATSQFEIQRTGVDQTSSRS